LTPGQAVTVTTTFLNPNRLGIGYNPKLYAGKP
jgi:hypothetical protein